MIEIRIGVHQHMIGGSRIAGNLSGVWAGCGDEGIGFLVDMKVNCIAMSGVAAQNIYT